MGFVARLAFGGAIALTLSGCVARTAWNVATAPVKVGSKAVDLATTSQSEADEKRGRELRKREARIGKLERKYDGQITDCQHGSSRACSDARVTHAQIEELTPTVPAERR